MCDHVSPLTVCATSWFSGESPRPVCSQVSVCDLVVTLRVYAYSWLSGQCVRLIGSHPCASDQLVLR